jgi:hypothetical protein
MQRFNLTALHRTAAKNLEDSLRHYDDAPVGLAQEFVELKLHACIFQYDVIAEMLGYLRNKPTGFAAVVAIKGLVLRLYEYDNLLNTSLIPRLLSLASSRRVAFDKQTIRQARKKCKDELKRLRRWSDFRNHVVGHYGKDLKLQVALLKQLNPVVVMSVTLAFLKFNKTLLVGLRDAGRGIRNDA